METFHKTHYVFYDMKGYPTVNYPSQRLTSALKEKSQFQTLKCPFA